MAGRPRGPPPQLFTKFERLLTGLLAKEPLVRGLAIFPDEVLSQSIPRELDQPREGRVGAGDPPPNAGLQREEQDPQQPLADLVPVLNDPVRLVLVGRGALLERRPGVKRLHAVPQRVDGLLIVGLQDHLPRNAEVLNRLGHRHRHCLVR